MFSSWRRATVVNFPYPLKASALNEPQKKPRERTVTPDHSPARLVAVIASWADVQRARRLRSSVDLLELRLDAFISAPEELELSIGTLPAPLIITARHPAEGGHNRLSVARRRGMLLRFLPLASLVDIELRSAASLRPVLDAAAASQVHRIISVHDFRRTPTAQRLHELARTAEQLGADIFKIATRTDTAAELERLVEFFETARGPMAISAMGIGKLGRASRKLLAQRGSTLNYAHLGTPQAEGQLSLAEVRGALNR